MSSTDLYYQRNAQQFIRDTLSAEMSALYEPFLEILPDNADILDAGCGSGRDAKAFQDRGYRVHAFDACEELAAHASDLLGEPVEVTRFENFDALDAYDGIWACASLLHVSDLHMPEVFSRLWRALRAGGVLYCSFKLGCGVREKDGRQFTDADEQRVRDWTRLLPGLKHQRYWVTGDVRSEREEKWLNVLLHREQSKLITGGAYDPFLPHLCRAIHQAHSIELAVAFVKTTGLRLLLPDLLDALQRQDAEMQPADVRILTSDYLDVTDPEALRLLMLLVERGADVRIFRSQGSSFHLKAYLFVGNGWGRAYIGSSNISRQALQHGLEWNYRVDYPADEGFLEARARFDGLFEHIRAEELTDAWIDAYEKRRVKPTLSFEAGSTESDSPPVPSKVQAKALEALSATRDQGYARGLVVLATGLGKTWLAAFDAKQVGARRVLFVAHREEILNQAAATFSRIQPTARIGFYRGGQRDTQVDVLCASVQTLGRSEHLNRFKPQHFDYVVVDEFHHASAPTYHRLLQHFAPAFLLGLTATPDRTDNANILELCDGNLVFETGLLVGVSERLLAPFHYYGVFDSDVDYQSIPWRNGKFNPELLANKLATLGRARSVLRQWRLHSQKKTLAFCASTRHAEYMADYFGRQGVRAAAVYADSKLSRGEALERLKDGRLEVLFSVDLFNEGVDLPLIDTVMMLRPTESKILFLQQLGRGLRQSEGKEKLVVLDFVANHHSFLHKPSSLMGKSMNYRQLAEFGKSLENGTLELPEGCFVNYDLRFVDFLKSLDSKNVESDYESLKALLGYRPSLTEFYRSGASLQEVRRQFGSWFGLVLALEEDLSQEERDVIERFRDFLLYLETTAMTKSYKMVLLEAFQELNGWFESISLDALAERSWQVLHRRRALLSDLPDEYLGRAAIPSDWLAYWLKNPVSALVKGSYFSAEDGFFFCGLVVPDVLAEPLRMATQELIDYRLASYSARTGFNSDAARSFETTTDDHKLAFFPNLKVACGHFKTGTSDRVEYRSIGTLHGQVNPDRHFIARASGNSMNGGKNPIKDGDYLLLELISPSGAGKITGDVMAIERQDVTGDNQYLLRRVLKDSSGVYRLQANNPDYEDIVVDDELQTQLRTFARLKAVLSPLQMSVGQYFMREDIPPLFDCEFSPGNWNSGHVVIPDRGAHVLLVTLNKQGKAEGLRYRDHWVDEKNFHWQTQNQTAPDNKRGREIIDHQSMGISLHLFVRENKLEQGKAAPFKYCGEVRYLSHSGSKPMSVSFEIM